MKHLPLKWSVKNVMLMMKISDFLEEKVDASSGRQHWL